MNGQSDKAKAFAAMASRDALSDFKSQTTAVIAHLTKTNQVELSTNQELRRRLAALEALNAAHLLRIDSLETACAKAERAEAMRTLMAQTAEDKVKVLGSALTATQQTCMRHETLVADLLATRSWRATASWRQIGRFWARSVRHRALRRKLARHFDTRWFMQEYPAATVLGMDPFIYFMDHGLVRDLNPNPCFDMRWYLRRYTDVASLGLHPLIHFQAHGFAEGREPHPDVTCAAYRARYEAGWAHA